MKTAKEILEEACKRINRELNDSQTEKQFITIEIIWGKLSDDHRQLYVLVKHLHIPVFVESLLCPQPYDKAESEEKICQLVLISMASCGFHEALKVSKELANKS